MSKPFSGYGVYTSQKNHYYKRFESLGCVMDDSPNAPQISGGVLSTR
ncbi:hypothetical protein [Nostoc sp. DSM 114161]